MLLMKRIPISLIIMATINDMKDALKETLESRGVLP